MSPGFDPVGAALLQIVDRQPGALVVDIGGGSGTRAVPLAVRGCQVIVVDVSIDALAILRRRAADAGVADRIQAVQADADALAAVVPANRADLVLCHHLLEVLDDPAAALRGVAAALKPGGIASVVTASRYAAVWTQASAGRAAEAQAMLSGTEGRWGATDPLRHRMSAIELTDHLTAAHLRVESVHGVDITGDRDLEAVLADHPILRELGTDLHAIARRPAD